MVKQINKHFDNDELGTYALIFGIIAFILSLISFAWNPLTIMVIICAGMGIRCSADALKIELNEGLAIAGMISACLSFIIAMSIIINAISTAII